MHQELGYNNSSRRGNYEGIKQENAQYSMNSLNYPNNVQSRNVNNQRFNEHIPNQYGQNQSGYSSSHPNQNRNFIDSHDEMNSNLQHQYNSQNNPLMNDNITLGQQNSTLNHNQNYLNTDPHIYAPSHIRKSSLNAPANPNNMNYHMRSSSSQNIQAFNQQPQQQQYQQCPSHPKYDITNICVADTCIEPLCPECVKIHTYMHNQKETPTNIDTILCKRDQCLDYVRELRGNFMKEESILNKIGDIDKGDIFQQCLDQIQKAKDLVFESINTYFNSFEIKIKQRINEIRTNHPHLFGNINTKIQSMISEIQDMEMKLQSPQYVKYIIQILSDDFNIDFERIQQDVDYGIEHYLTQLFSVQVQPEFLNQLDDLMQKYVSTEKININEFQWRENGQQSTHQILHSNLFVKKSNQIDPRKNKENQYNIQDLFQTSQKKIVPQPLDYNTVSFPTQQTHFNQNQSDMFDVHENISNLYNRQPNQTHQLKGRPKSEHVNPYQSIVPNQVNGNKGLDGDQSPLNRSEISVRDDRAVNINTFDYFTPDCPMNIIHFFQDNSKSFHFLDLSVISKDPSTQEWQTVILNIDFKIPMFHRSIITPNGKIYLIGGIDVVRKNKSMTNTYYLDMNRNSLELCAYMNFERNSHSLVVAQDSIFVVGGQNSNEEDIYLTSCERFDIESHKWIQIADIQEGVCGAVLSNFNDKFIYRYGGKTYLGNQSNQIERYNIQEDYWEFINYNFSDAIPYFSGACQINENEMIILGGQVGEINQRQSLVARVDYSQQDKISFYYVKNMPQSGTFWQNPIVGGNVIFAMQNIKMENSQMNYFSKKSLFIFNCRTWKELGQK